MASTQELQDFTQQVRRDILRMVHAVNSGHPGGSLGCAEFFTVLYQEVLEYSTDFKMNGENENLFFLSNGHISPVYYSVLARSGFFPVEELATFRKMNTRLQGHPTTHEGLPGIRIASGIDLNGKQIDGATDDVLPMGSIRAKFEAFGWVVIDIIKGNDVDSIIKGLSEAKSKTGKGKPVCVLLHTEMGNGIDFMMHTHAWHGKAPNDDQLTDALNQNPVTLGDY